MHLVGWLGALLLGASLWAAPNPEMEAWRATDLDLATTQIFISNALCHHSAESIRLKYLRSCTAAINAAAFHAGLSFHLDPTGSQDIDFNKLLNNLVTQLPEGFPAQAFFATAINTHLQAFDPHASLTADQSRAISKEDLVGLGIQVSPLRRGWIIDEVLPGSPGDLAGLGFGDLITAAGKTVGSLVDIAKLSGNQVDDLFNGSQELGLSILRGSEDEVVSLHRGPYKIQNVESEMIVGENKIAYVHIRHFEDDTCYTVRDRLASLQSQGARRLILDLRGNPGGNVNEALCTSGLFVGGWKKILGIKYIGTQIPQKSLVQAFDTAPEMNWMPDLQVQANPIPLVVLVDARSASGSEVVAGSLQLEGRAWLVGERTFGKGSKQTSATLTDHPSLVVTSTTALYYFTNEKSDQALGLEPSFVIPYKVGATAEERYADREKEIFSNTFAAQNEAWSDSRTEQIGKIQDCISAEGRDKKVLARITPKNRVGDYQKAFAIAILKSVDGQNAANCHPKDL